MRVPATIVLLLVTGAALAQQRAPVFADPTGRTSPAPPPPAAAPARFANPNTERLTPEQQRCRNLQQEIVRAEERSREAMTTGAQDQFALQRQRLMEQKTRIGC